MTAASKRPPPARVAATMVGLWHMNETSGTTMKDSSGASRNGTLKGSPLPTVGLPGYLDRAYGFAPTGYVSVPGSRFEPRQRESHAHHAREGHEDAGVAGLGPDPQGLVHHVRR